MLLRSEMFYGLPMLFSATLCASFAANVVSNPFDVVKSRMQNMPVRAPAPCTPRAPLPAPLSRSVSASPTEPCRVRQGVRVRVCGAAQVKADGSAMYTSMADCFTKSIKSEGHATTKALIPNN